MFRNFFMFFVFLVYGCDSQEMNNELMNKSEYSILQSYEYNYREAINDTPYLVFKHALKTDSTVVAFPIKGKKKGYVVLIADSKGKPKIKAMPDVDFVVTQSAYNTVKGEVSLSDDVDNFIKSHILAGNK